MPSHALLLRLFLSPSYFSVHVALRYLLLYPDNIGITYYLTSRLKQLDVAELRDVWGFVCHLLVTRPSKSRALECFVVEIAQRSTHICMITLWFMQATLKDLAINTHDSPSFLLCQKILHACHEIIFGDLPPKTLSPYVTLNLPSVSRLSRRKIKPNTEPAIVGIGMVLAGTPVMPKLTEIMGEVAVEQGRVDDHGHQIKSREEQDEEYAQGLTPTQKQESMDSAIDDQDEQEEPEDFDEQNATPSVTKKPDQPPLPVALKRRRTIEGARTMPALPLHLRPTHCSRPSDDALGQLDLEENESSAPYSSSPALSSARPTPRTATMNRADSILETYDPQSQVQLLRGHYCRSEVNFILGLENICNRLLVIPRPARVSALRAELTALNHKLPAEVCMPMWCTSADSPITRDSTQPHHRIVRIPPGESVVLNSAERAPFLLYIEVLHDDLDFVPNKRSNKEVLKNIVAKEDQKHGSFKDFNPFTVSVNTGKLSHTPDSSLGTDPITPASANASIGSPIENEDDEEIDLVEQLYGTDLSLRSQPVDLSESIVLPRQPKNRDLDMAAWSRSPSTPSTPIFEQLPPKTARHSSSQGYPPPTPTPSSLSRSQTLPSPLPSASPSQGEDDSNNLSLDEYSERMRTAAIMLAQLNSSMREMAGPSAPQPGQAQPEGTKGGAAEQAHHMRMKLQHAEATAIKDRIMKEMLALEEQRMERMRENREMESVRLTGGNTTAEDEGIIRRELNKVDPSAIVFSESWAAKKSRIRHSSPYGHLANWDCVSVIVKTGGDLRQEQLAIQLIQVFQQIWEEEKCGCWVRYFRILITGGTSGLMETITDAVSIHSIKKAEYARRIATGKLGHVTIMDHFRSTYGDPSSAKFIRAQRNFAKSLAGYSIVTYLLQIKDRHNGNILLDRDGHLIHIDFGFMLSNTPGNIGFEAAPFKLPLEYVEVLGGVDGQAFLEFRRLFKEGFQAARKHGDRIITLVELMQKDSTFPCFAALGEQTSAHLRDRFQPLLTHSLVGDYTDRLIDSSLGSHWTRLYDSFQYYSQSIL